MSETKWQDEIGSWVRIAQIIVAALTTGTVLFLVVAIVLVAQGAFVPEGEASGGELRMIMECTLGLFLVGVLIARMIAPGQIVARARRRIAAGQWVPGESAQAAKMASFIERTGDAGRLMGVFLTKTIVAAALFEGVAFFALIVFMLTQSIIALSIALALIVGLVLHFPTRSGVVHWIEDQLVIVEQERSLGPA